MIGLQIFMCDARKMALWDEQMIYNSQDLFDNTWKEMDYITRLSLISEFGSEYALEEHGNSDYIDLVKKIGYDKALSGLKIYLNDTIMGALESMAQEARVEAHGLFYEDMGEPDDLY